MPKLVVSDVVKAPALFGLFRPVILLPTAFAASADPSSMRLVLLHELAHLRRRDLWSQLFGSVLQAAHWFNPVLWWACRRLRAEAEMAADERAVRMAEGGAAHRMGELLLGFVQPGATSLLMLLTTSTMLGIDGSSKEIKRRVRALVDLGKGRRSWWAAGAGLFLLLAVSGLTKPPAEEAPPTERVTITGTVVDDTGKPVPGADCRLSAELAGRKNTHKTISDAEGRFTLQVPKDLELPELWARGAEHLDSPRVGLGKDDFSKEQRLVLGTNPPYMTGSVIRKDTWAPVAGAKVYVTSFKTPPNADSLIMNMLMQNPVRMTVTDARGIYRFPVWSKEPVDAGIIVEADRLTLVHQTVKLPGNGELPELRPEPMTNQELNGIVVDAAGRPLEGVQVSAGHRLSMFSLMSSDKVSSLFSTWRGTRVTGADGRFSGRVLESSFSSQRGDPSLILLHPELGYRVATVEEWKAGDKVTLTAWSIVEGRVTQPDGKPAAGLEVRLTRFEKNGLSKTERSVTDADGRYRMTQVLAGDTSGLLSVSERPADPGKRPKVLLSVGPHRPGETLTANVQLKDEPELDETHHRTVTGHVRPPAERVSASDKYEIVVRLAPLGNVGASAVKLVNGRFHSNPLPPGDYLLRVWVSPKDRTLSSLPGSSIALPFRLEKQPGNPTLDLGELPLPAEAFQFKKVSEVQRVPEGRTQKIGANIVSGGPLVSWAGSNGNGVGKERHIDGKQELEGVYTLRQGTSFMLRGVKSDGSRVYSPCLTCTKDEGAVYDKPVPFSSGVAVRGKIMDLPVGYAGEGWVVAEVQVNSAVELGKLIKGGLRTVTWHAWAPVKKDGSFVFPSLPRGALTVQGFGDGWTLAGAGNVFGTLWVNLSNGDSERTVKAFATPTHKQTVKVLLPDGSAAKDVAVAVAPNVLPLRSSPFVQRSRAAEPEDQAAYDRYRNQKVPWHHATTNESGEAVLRNLIYQAYSTTAVELRWTDPVSKAVRRQQSEVKVGTAQPLVIKLEP